MLESVDDRNVGMIQCRKRLRLAVESGKPLGVVRERFGNDLDRHHTVELRVACAIDLAHAAGTKRRDDLIGPQPSTGRESQERSL